MEWSRPHQQQQRQHGGFQQTDLLLGVSRRGGLKKKKRKWRASSLKYSSINMPSHKSLTYSRTESWFWIMTRTDSGALVILSSTEPTHTLDPRSECVCVCVCHILLFFKNIYIYIRVWTSFFPRRYKTSGHTCRHTEICMLWWQQL